MTKAAIRLASAFVIAAVLFGGLASRFASRSPDPELAKFKSVDLTSLRPAERIGGFVFEQIEGDGSPALRMRQESCSEPIYAVPMLLTAVTITEVMDGAYLKPGYSSSDVYRGAVKASFSHVERWFEHVGLQEPKLRDRYFVRFYAAKACQITDRELSEAAEALMKRGDARV